MKAVILILGALCCKTLADNAIKTCSKSEGSVGVSSNAPFWKGIPGAEFVEELTDASYETFVQNNPMAFIMYYGTYCRYAKASRKGFAGAAKELKGQVAFGAVDCSKQRQACDPADHPVEGVPTFYLYKDAEWNDQYRYERSQEAFVEYLNSKM